MLIIPIIFVSIIFFSVILLSKLVKKETYTIYDDDCRGIDDEYEKQTFMKIGIEYDTSEKIRILIPAMYLNNFSWVSDNNWLNTNIILPDAKIQGKCWCCYAFTTADVLSSVMYMYYQDNTRECFDFSVQQIIDCTSSPDGDGSRPSQGCYIGSMSKLIDKYFNTQRFLTSNTIYPYVSVNTTRIDYSFPEGNERCQTINSLYTTNPTQFTIIGKLELLNIKDESCARNAMYIYGCLYCSFGGVSSDSFKNYPSTDIIGDNIYNGPANIPGGTSHAMTVVGWGVDSNNIPYWLVKNTKGKNWGVNKDTGTVIPDNSGYIRIIRNSNKFKFMLTARPSRPCIPNANIINISCESLIYKIDTTGIITVKVQLDFKIFRINKKQKISIQMLSSQPANSSDITCNPPNNSITFKTLSYKGRLVESNNIYYFNKYIGKGLVKSDLTNGLYFYTSSDPIILYGKSYKNVTTNRTPTGIWCISCAITNILDNSVVLQENLTIDMTTAKKSFFTS